MLNVVILKSDTVHNETICLPTHRAVHAFKILSTIALKRCAYKRVTSSNTPLPINNKSPRGNIIMCPSC